MKHPSQEDLLGYVLGALDAQEERELQEQIDANPEIEEQMLQIRSAMAPMDSLDFGEPGNRPGLARRTCELVANLQHCKQDLFEDSDAIRDMFDDAPVPEAVLATADERKTSGSAFSRFSDRLVHPSSMSRIDILAGVAMLAIFLSILFPAISHSRFQGRIASCKHNLTQVGNAMLTYSDLHCGKFMDIAEFGFSSANTGLFAPVLRSSGFVDDDAAFACAGRMESEPPRIPTMQQLLNAKGFQLESLKRRMGGHFGYAMGFIEGQQYFAPRNDGASHTLLIADIPSVDMPGRSSSNHSGEGQNCFFADGRVQFVRSHSVGSDAIYENDLGIVSPGIGPHDNVIAPCHVPAVKVTVLSE